MYSKTEEVYTMALESSAQEQENGSAFDNSGSENTPDNNTNDRGNSGSHEDPVVDVSGTDTPGPADGGVSSDAPTDAPVDDTIDVSDPSQSDSAMEDLILNGGGYGGNGKTEGDSIDEPSITATVFVESDPEPTEPNIEVTEPVIDIPTEIGRASCRERV